MIALEDVTLTVREHARRRIVLRRASHRFGPGVVHLSADPADDARLLIELLAGFCRAESGSVQGRGLRSWPLARFAPFGMYMTGLDIIDTLCSLYELERRETFQFFRRMLDQPEWLAQRFDRMPQAAQRQFAHTAFLAPDFAVYLLDLTPILPFAEFYRRWRPLFLDRIAGKIVIMATGDHRAAMRDFPGERLLLASGRLERAPIAFPIEREAVGAPR
jgi:hypothetical protein